MDNVAYVLLRFPFLTETFVADEIWHLKSQGFRVRVLSLLPPRNGAAHRVSSELAKETRYAPEWYSPRLWAAQLYFLLHCPRRYLDLLIRLLRQPRRGAPARTFLQRMLIFLKAVALALELRKAGIQLVHTHFAWLSGAAAMVISGLLRIPYTVTVHAYDIYASNDLLEFVVRSASKVIAISEYNKVQVLAAAPGLSQDSIAVIHCGIDLTMFTPAHPNHREGPLRILSVGSLIEKKGHTFLIGACEELQARGVNLICTIIGQGPQAQAVQELIRARGLEKRVVLAGGCSREEVLQAYCHADLFVLASVVAADGDRDGIPVVLMEAMAMRLPVISTHVSGIPELVRHDETGWLVPERDARSIADAVLFLSTHGEKSERLACNGRALIEQQFNIRSNVGRLAKEFRTAIAQAHGEARG